MAYSRWYNSHWYIYWGGGITRHRNQEELVLMYPGGKEKRMSYLEVLEYLKDPKPIFGDSDPVIVESMEKFVKDVQEEWPTGQRKPKKR